MIWLHLQKVYNKIKKKTLTILLLFFHFIYLQILWVFNIIYASLNIKDKTVILHIKKYKIWNHLRFIFQVDDGDEVTQFICLELSKRYFQSTSHLFSVLHLSKVNNRMLHFFGFINFCSAYENISFNHKGKENIIIILSC